MKKAMFELLTESSPLQQFYASQATPEQFFDSSYLMRLYGRSAVPDAPELPMLVLGWSEAQRVFGMGSTYRRNLSIYAYQERGSYVWCEKVLDVIEAVLSDTEDYWSTVHSERLASVRINGRSSELYDDQWRANFITLDMTCVGSGSRDY